MARESVRLKKELSRSVRAGHPWIYRDALRPARHPTGTVVDLLAVDGKFLARGLWDADSPIAFRAYTLDPEEIIDAALVQRRLGEALRARRGAIDARETNAFRWCNGEGDFLPGVVVDLYASVVVVRFDGEAVKTLRPFVVEALVALGAPLGVAHIYERSRGGEGRALHGDEPPVPVEILEAGVRFGVDVKRGQKTGTFLDQRENRRSLRPYASGARVANLFCYTGGFSVHAALGGATRVDSVDSAAAALDTARENFTRNGIDPARHGFFAEDVFAWLTEQRQRRQRYGLLIVDPPSFAPKERAVSAALTAYRDLFAQGLSILDEEGVIAACSCSSHVTMDALVSALSEASVRAARPLRILELRGQPADHPSLPAFPEGRYLKMIVARARALQ